MSVGVEEATPAGRGAPPRGPTGRRSPRRRPRRGRSQRRRARRRRSPRPQAEGVWSSRTYAGEEAVPEQAVADHGAEVARADKHERQRAPLCPREPLANDWAPALHCDRVLVALQRAPDVERPPPRRWRSTSTFEARCNAGRNEWKSNRGTSATSASSTAAVRDGAPEKDNWRTTAKETYFYVTGMEVVEQ